ncbi:glycosyltransferase family 39 protein [Tundrisphaera sp. TA3]|uniref:glycosyltransferase family 39 protein n=1 Tax=Tundrisphaera sp. TA3 TaxID=3435775 RepID=UPI003EBA54C3
MMVNRFKLPGTWFWLSGSLITVVAAVSILMNADRSSPPRYDGASYAVLGRALAEGQGYRDVFAPEPARHTHFPPGYPLGLASLWRFLEPSSESAHIFSVACTIVAIFLAWLWFRSMYTNRIALGAALALAINWTWGRTGGLILSEPLFFLIDQAAILYGVRVGRRGGVGRGMILGALLGLGVLTRHVAITLVLAMGIELILRRRTASLFGMGLASFVLVLPWVVWLMSSPHRNQAGLFTGDGLASLIGHQAVFYLQRLPDQWVGPIVEIGTEVARSPILLIVVNLWAVLATSLIGWGWVRTLRSPRRRLAGLVPLATLPLLLIWPFTEAGRFLIPLVPCLIVGAIEGLARPAAWLGFRRPRAWAALVVVTASLPYPAYAIIAGRAEARRLADRPFDEACRWISRHGGRPGPVLSMHPAEVYWTTGRVGLGVNPDDPEEAARSIDRLGVAYLLIDDNRYARSPANPIAQFIERHPDRVRQVWRRDAGASSVCIYEVIPELENAAP